MPRPLVIGTRGSALALWQARAVQDAILAVFPEQRVEVRVITTVGDMVLDKPLESIGGKGLFTKELENELLSGEVDLCVHSAKDMTTSLPQGCVLGAMLPRADARDVLVCGPRIAGASSLAGVPEGSRIGTGSIRRSSQLRAFHPHIRPVSIRGNVDTRLAKANGPDYEGVILAAAGVERMGEGARIAARIPVACLVPAVGQGAIAVEARADDAVAARFCRAIDHVETSVCVAAERRVLAALEGGCQAPIGAFARFELGKPLFDAIVCALDGSRWARARCKTLDVDEVLCELRDQGAEDILSRNEAMGAWR